MNLQAFTITGNCLYITVTDVSQERSNETLINQLLTDLKQQQVIANTTVTIMHSELLPSQFDRETGHYPHRCHTPIAVEEATILDPLAHLQKITGEESTLIFYFQDLLLPQQCKQLKNFLQQTYQLNYQSDLAKPAPRYSKFSHGKGA